MGEVAQAHILKGCLSGIEFICKNFENRLVTVGKD